MIAMEVYRMSNDSWSFAETPKIVLSDSIPQNVLFAHNSRWIDSRCACMDVDGGAINYILLS